MTTAFLRYAIVLIAAGGIELFPAPAAFGQERICSLPESFSAFEPPLLKTAKALTGGREVVIVALGGASTLGVAAGGAELAWPARLAAALSEKFPSARTKGNQPRCGAPDGKADGRPPRSRHPLLEADACNLGDRHHGGRSRTRCRPVPGDPRDWDRAVASRQGRTGLNEHAVLTRERYYDPFGPYLTAIRELADANDVPLFRRHEIMRYWAPSGLLDLRNQ